MDLDLLLDTPWWLPAGLALVGIAVWVSGNKRRDRALMNIGLVGLLVAVAVTAISYFVDTPKERAEKSTRTFVDAVVKQDLDTARAILHPSAYVRVLGAATPYANREEIIRAIDRADQEIGLTGASIMGLTSTQTDDVITITFTLFSEQTATMGRPLQTKWEFQFQQTAGGWNLWAITLLQGAGMTPNQAQRQFPSVH